MFLSDGSETADATVLAGPRRFADEVRHRQGDRNHQQAEDAQRAAPAPRLRQREREERNERPADADAEVGDAHRLAAALVEPARQQHLVRQRPAEHIAERVEGVEEIERAEAGHIRQADERAAGHHDAAEHQPARAEPVHEPTGEKPERQRDEDLAVGVARRHLLPRPAELLHEIRIEARQAVQGEADDGKEREKGRQDGDDLPGTLVGMTVHGRAGAFALFGGVFAPLRAAASGCATYKRIERVAARHQTEPRAGRAVAERPAHELARERLAGEHVGRELGIRQHHAAEADEVGHAMTQRVLADVRQPLLQVGVRGPDEDQVGELAT